MHKKAFIEGLMFSKHEYHQCLKERGMLRLSIEIGGEECNLKCTSCYCDREHDRGAKPGSGRKLLTTNRILQLVDEAVEVLGAKAIELTGGGEPLMREDWMDIVKYIYSKETKNKGCVIPVIFTNGTLIDGDQDKADFLMAHNVTLVIKLHFVDNSLLHDRLVGYGDAHDVTMESIKSLKKAGYGTRRYKLAIESIITRYHLNGGSGKPNELEKLWMYCRQENFFPYFEIPKLMGRALQADNIRNLKLSSEEIWHLFERIRELDKNYEWEPVPPIIGHQCTLYYWNTYVTCRGAVQACSGVPIGYGNVQDKRLAEIIHSREYQEEVRHVNRNLKGKCRDCPRSQGLLGCYGCRASGYWPLADDGKPKGDMNEADEYCLRQNPGKVIRID